MSAPTPTNSPHEEMRYTTPPSASPYGPPPVQPTPRKNNTALIVTIVAIVVLVPVAACIGAALLAGGFGAFVATRGGSNWVEQTTTSQFQLAVPDHPTITISDTAGQVTITRGAVEQVMVVATKRARAATNESARNLFNSMTVTANATASGANINATIDQNQPLNQRSVDLRITAPQISDLTVTLNAGTFTMTSITGVFKVTSNAGTVVMQDVTAQGASSVNVTAGMFRFDGALAQDVTLTAIITTGNANIRLPQASATHFEASTRVGSVTVSSWTATIQRSGVGQSTAFDLNPQPTNTMNVRVDIGSITLATR